MDSTPVQEKRMEGAISSPMEEKRGNDK